jgi:NCS1 family nucleobase:cation symporter-1
MAVGGLLTALIAIGWFSYDCAVAVYTASALPVFGAGPPAWAVGLMLLAMVVGCIAVAVFGHRTLTIVQTVQAPTFLLLCAVVAYFLMPHLHPGYAGTLSGGDRVQGMLLGFTATFALIVSWVTYAGDYSRYLPRRSGGLSVSLCSGLGSVVTLVLCGVLGALVQSIDPKEPNLAKLIVDNVPAWLAWTFVAFIVVAEMSSNYLNIYTAALSALAIGIRMRRWLAALVVGLLGGAFAVWILVRAAQTGGAFQYDYLNFLTVTYVWFPAWSVVVLADFWTRRRAASDPEDWDCPRAYRPIPLLVFALGTLATLAFYNQKGLAGPFNGWGSAWLFRGGVADISGVVGVAASLLLFLALMRLRPAPAMRRERA